MQGRILIIAGSDSGGGAGIQADIKTVTALGGYAATALTALTAQNTESVARIEAISASFVRQQMETVLADIGADALKTGMLHTAEIVETVVRVIEEKAPSVPLVVDPVIVAKGGEALLDGPGIKMLKDRLLLRASVMTPNLPEAEVLTGLSITSPGDLEHAAQALLALGSKAVLLTGGHLKEKTVRDVLATPDCIEVFEGPRIETLHTHGTGCTLASAIATGLAQGLALRDAVLRARIYVQEAIRTAPGFGRGYGPLNHGHPLSDQKESVT